MMKIMTIGMTMMMMMMIGMTMIGTTTTMRMIGTTMRTMTPVMVAEMIVSTVPIVKKRA
jgi:hypothetical protein